jgi:CubicO group peptidase (beta-lactamase class C family)
MPATTQNDARLTDADFPSVRALFEKHVAQQDIAGAVLAVAVGDEEPCFVSVGETGMGTGRAVGPTSLHRIYSQTKPVTGVAIMMLIEEGKLHLEQPLGEVLPAFADLKVLVSEDGDAVRAPKRPPTVRDLLTHTAGFSYALQISPLAARYRQAGLEPGVRIAEHQSGSDRPRDLSELMARLSRLPLARDPGEMFEYSLSIDVLGAMVEAISGSTLEAFFQERIFEPLGMHDTSFVVADDKLDRLVNLHQRGADGDWRLIDHAGDSAYARPAVLSGGGGLVSTAKDYTRFTAMLAGEGETRGVRLLQPETVRLARSNLLPPGVGVQFFGNVLPAMGFGAAMQTPLAAMRMPAGVFGWGGAAGTGMWVDPIHRLHIVLMTQYMPAEINLSLREDPAAAVYADLGLWPAGDRERLS